MRKADLIAEINMNGADIQYLHLPVALEDLGEPQVAWPDPNDDLMAYCGWVRADGRRVICHCFRAEAERWLNRETGA